MFAKTLRLKRFFFSAKLLSSNVETVALTRAHQNVGETHDIRFEASFTLSLAGHIDMLFFRCLFVIFGFCLLFGWMLFLAESLSSLWKYFCLSKNTPQCLYHKYSSRSLLYVQLSIVFIRLWGTAYKVFSSFHAVYNQGRLKFFFFTWSKGRDDVQSFLSYVLSTKLFFRFRFSSASCAHPSQQGLW